MEVREAAAGNAAVVVGRVVAVVEKVRVAGGAGAGAGPKPGGPEGSAGVRSADTVNRTNAEYRV